MKLLRQVLLGFIVIVALGVGAVFYFTSGLVDEADRFFAAIRSGKSGDAYAMLSAEFRRSSSQEQLVNFLKSYDLDKVRDASWSGRKIESGQGALDGVVTTATGSTLPINISFVKEGGRWKILGLKTKPSGIQEDPGTSAQKALQAVTLPEEREQILLVKESVRIFGQSINEKSMATFHRFISELWKTQYDVEKLEAAYKGLYSIEGDLTKISTLSPVFSDEAKLDERGVMYIAGYFLTQPSRVNFEHRYIMEGTKWKLLGFNIKVSGQG